MNAVDKAKGTHLIIGRCKGCEKAEMISAQDGWSFPACYHPPYQGKWTAEIKDCPKLKEATP